MKRKNKKKKYFRTNPLVDSTYRDNEMARPTIYNDIIKLK